MSIDTQDVQEAPVPLAVKFANSDIPDDVLLRLLDSVTAALENRECHFSGRHSSASQTNLLTSLCRACELRGINANDGVKVVTTTVNLLV